MKEERKLLSIVNPSSLKIFVGLCLNFHSKLPIMDNVILRIAPQAKLNKWQNVIKYPIDYLKPQLAHLYILDFRRV